MGPENTDTEIKLVRKYNGQSKVIAVEGSIFQKNVKTHKTLQKRRIKKADDPASEIEQRLHPSGTESK